MKVFAGKAACLGMLISTALPALAQETGAGRTSVFSIGVGLDAGSNVDIATSGNGADYKAFTRLGYDYALKTSVTELTFGISANPEFVDGEDTTAQPKASLSFTHREARSEFSIAASYQRSKITDQSIGYDENSAPFYYEGTGERSRANLSARLTGGIDRPFGYTLELNRNETDYHGVIATDQSPSRNTGAKLNLRADLSATRQIGLSFSHSLYDVDNADNLQRRSDSAALRFDQQINAVTRLGFSVGRSEVESERNSSTKTSSGTTVGVSLQRDDPRGTTELRYDRSISETGKRDTVSLLRKAEMRLGTFDGSIGLSRGEADVTDVIAGLGYALELPRDTLSLDLSRRITTNDAGADVLTTQVSGSYDHKLNELNALNFGLSASFTDTTSEKTTRVDGTVAYNHDLTPEAQLSAGVRLGLSKRTGREDADGQAVFISFNRRFETQR